MKAVTFCIADRCFYYSVHTIHINDGRQNNKPLCLMQHSSIAPQTAASKMITKLKQHLFQQKLIIITFMEEGVIAALLH